MLSATPAKLVRMLYEAALRAVTEAIAAVDAGDIGLRSQKIAKAVSIVNELATSLNVPAAGQWGRDLVELYDYMARRLHAANFEQCRQPLDEVHKLLETLLEGWRTLESSSGSESRTAFSSSIALDLGSASESHSPIDQLA